MLRKKQYLCITQHIHKLGDIFLEYMLWFLKLCSVNSAWYFIAFSHPPSTHHFISYPPWLFPVSYIFTSHLLDGRLGHDNLLLSKLLSLILMLMIFHAYGKMHFQCVSNIFDIEGHIFIDFAVENPVLSTSSWIW